MPHNKFYLTEKEIEWLKSTRPELAKRYLSSEKEYNIENGVEPYNWHGSYPTWEYPHHYDDLVSLISAFVTDFMHDDHDEIIYGFDYAGFEKQVKKTLQDITEIKPKMPPKNT